MLSVTLPPSGRGVTLSLALDHAPFTKMTPSGTLVCGCVLLEKSPPFRGALCCPLVWPHASNDTDQAATNEKRRNPECISLLRTLLSVAHHFPTLSNFGRNWRDTFMSRQ